MEKNANEQKLWTRVKRKLVRIFLTQGNCDSSCSSCSVCPWIDKEKYSFEIKRKIN